MSGRGANDIALDINRTTEAAGVYPIVLASYHIVCSTYADQATVDLVKGFETYVISAEGQDAAGSAAGSAPITDAIRDKGPSGDRRHHHQVTPATRRSLARTSGRRVPPLRSRPPRYRRH